MATERLILEVRTQGTRQVNRDIGRIRKEASSANRTLALLRSTLVVVAGARVISGFLEMADVLTNVRNRLRLVTNSTEQLNAVQARLFSISQETRSSLEDNALFFNRLARSTDGLGLTFNELLDITRGVTQTLAISGATAQEARNALIQFSQGLAAGALRGDELRSVVEQLPALADAIAREFDITAESTARSLGVTEAALQSAQKEVGNLSGGALVAFAKANDGILRTDKIVRALQKSLIETDAQFAKIDITVGQAFTKFQNELTLFIGGLSNSIRLGKQVDTVLTLIARNLDLITASLAALLAIGAFNLITSQVLRFGSALRGVVSFLTAGFTALFTPLIAGARGAVTAAVFMARGYVTAAKTIMASFKGAMTFLKASAIATSRAVTASLVLISGAMSVIVGATRRAAAGFLILTSVVGGARAVFVGLAAAASGFVKLLATGLVRLIPLAATFAGAILAALLPALAIGAALVAAFFAIRFAVQKLEERFGSLGDIVNRVLGGFFGLVDGIVQAFSSLPDAIADLGIQAVNGLIDAFEFGVGKIADVLRFLGVDIDAVDLGRLENRFEGSAARVKDILATNINAGIEGGFRETKSFQTLSALVDQVKNLLTGGILPEDFDDAKLKALLDQISGTRDGLAEVSKEGEKAATSIRKIRAAVDPAEAAFKRINDAFEAFQNVSKEGIGQTEFARETLRLLAEDILDVVDSERQYNAMLEVVTQAQEKLGLSAERAALARKQLALAARQDFDQTLSAVFPLIRAEGQLLKIETDLERLRVNGQISASQQAEATKRLARESFGLSQTSEQLNEQISALRQNQELLGLSTAELEHEIRQLNIAFLEQQRTAGAGAERAILKLVDQTTDAAAFMEKTFQDAFKGIEDAVVEFTQTGTFSVNEFFRNFAEQLIRLGTQQALAGFGGFFGNLFGGQGGFGFGGPSSSSLGGIGGSITGLLGGLFGFQNGGSFTVGANTALQSLPGVDNRLIAFRARDGEDVTITPRGQEGSAMAPVNQIFNIQARDADSFKRSQTQIQNRALAGINQARRRR